MYRSLFLRICVTLALTEIIFVCKIHFQTSFFLSPARSPALLYLCHMPEIAEVELIRRDLEPFLGRVISSAEVCDPDLHLNRTFLDGRTIVAARRHGKLLGLDLDSGQILAIHLRLTGNLLSWEELNARLRLRLEPEGCLSLVDSRRFATCDIVLPENFAAGSGPDLFDSLLTSDSLIARVGRSKRAVKAVLLDQHVLAGLGNYLTDETLWRSQITPTRPATEISADEWETILASAKALARLALSRGGMSFSDYRRLDGSRGDMWQELYCYGHAGQPCTRCGTQLVKSSVGGRGTVACPGCQK